jgi:hypothetical protein
VFWKKLERPDEGEDWSKIRVGERVAAVVRRIAEVEGSMSKGTRAAAQAGFRERADERRSEEMPLSAGSI